MLTSILRPEAIERRGEEVRARIMSADDSGQVGHY
jgi:hypothetical protein